MGGDAGDGNGRDEDSSLPTSIPRPVAGVFDDVADDHCAASDDLFPERGNPVDDSPMTRIERVDVEGFKGIESLDVEPTAVNVVTGRNNTGKTSLLEAVELVFDPGTVEQFGGNVDTLVNVDYGRAVITAGTEGGRTSLELRHPDRERAREVLFETTYEFWLRLLDELQRNDGFDVDVLESVREELRAFVGANLTEEVVRDATGAILLLLVDGEEYPYLFPSSAVRTLHENIRSDLKEAMYERAELDADGVQRHTTELAIQFDFMGGATPLFVGEEPPSSDAVTFVDIPDLTDRPETGDGERDAVKIDDVEDFLVDEEIVEDLRDFDLDYLVFEDEDGEKYSVPYEFMGDGFKAVVGVLWELLDDDLTGDVVLLEEPGTHMHPGYVRELVYFLVEIAREEDVQLFVTTHNNDFVSDFFGENLADEERSFLREEFTLVQMQEEAAEVMSYEEAEQHLKDLHLDLRGL